jgi:hypothetical protein
LNEPNTYDKFGQDSTAGKVPFRNRLRRPPCDPLGYVVPFFWDMRRITGVHAEALRKGRYAYFDTMNVQGEIWHRRKLLDT